MMSRSGSSIMLMHTTEVGGLMDALAETEGVRFSHPVMPSAIQEIDSFKKMPGIPQFHTNT